MLPTVGEEGDAMRFSHGTPKLSIALATSLLSVAAALARAPAPLAQDVANELSLPVAAGQHVVIPRLTLDDGTTVSLDLEAFEVFAPGAEIIEYTEQGPRRLAPPADRYFRGTVIGDLDSVVMLASGAKLRGFVSTKGQVYVIAPDRDVYADNVPDPIARLRRLDPERDRPVDMPPFRCDIDSLPAPLGEGMSATALAAPISVQPLSTSTVYTVNLAIETDYELYQLFLSSTDGELRFIGDLTAAASAIYWRDVKTVFKIGTLHLWSTSSDPWSATDTSSALTELMSYWRSNYGSVQRTIVHMLSGKGMGGGIAYLSVLCNTNYGFGLSSSLSRQFSITNPNAYWDILCYTHEIGHNSGSPHTHCYSPPVDHCWNSEGGCYSGPLCANGTSDPCAGTIMSYCHMRSGGYSNITLVFGQVAQPSQAVLDTMRGYIESKAACLGPLAAAPMVTEISPNAGSTSGGTPVTISGTGFQSYATVTIGSVNATAVTIVSSTTITATTGAHAAGTVNVVVQNPDSQSGTKPSAYTYGTMAPAPTVTGINPGFGSTSGGTPVTIGGSNFVAGATVSLGGSPAAVGSVTANSITATTSGHAAGFVNVVVQNPDNQTGTLTNGFEYRAAPIAIDLIVSALSAPATGAAGLAITVTSGTKNQGSDPASASTTKFYLSTDSTWDAGDVLLGSRAIATLAPGAVSSGSTSLSIPAGTIAGNYFVIAKADADNSISETIETNNTASAPIAIGPDLIVSALTAPSSALAGSTISVTDTTKNQAGTSPASASTTKFYLSTNSTWDAADTLIGGRSIPALAAGASNSGPANATIPAGKATGTYYIIAKADGDGVLIELNETNNTKYVSIRISPPDLIVSAISVPTASSAGLSITATNTTKNQTGTGPAATSTTRFYLSANATLDGSDPLIGSQGIGLLLPSASEAHSTTLNIPPSTTPGTYYVIAKADADGLIPETIETNNTAYDTIVIGPDLIVSALSVPSTGGPGLPITVTDTTKNQGGGSASASTTRFYLSTDTTVGAEDVLLGSRSVAALNSGVSSSGSTTLTIPAGTAVGSYYVIAVADGPGSVAETVETNNTKYALIKLSPDLVVSALGAPTSATAGATITVTDTTKNQGAGTAAATTTSFYLSTNTTCEAGDAPLGSRSVPILAYAATSSGSTTVIIPAGTAPGTWYVLARADATNTVAEASETNNVRSKVITITP